ncbi:MAG: Z1 domain-containing protein [Puia sp.]|nr:Z1 domain-containing protein [Puia sp.]
MNHQEIIEAIKTLIKLQAPEGEGIPLTFFDEQRDLILTMLKMKPALRNMDSVTLNDLYTTAVREYKSVYLVDINPSSALTKKGFHTWLTEKRKAELPTEYIGRYLTYMGIQGRPQTVILELARSSEAILGKLGDPHSDTAFYTKGLVVGSVQSGKTGNFNAVINRAVDAGYNLVVILSGIMEDLRSQTQLRLEMDVIGEGMIDLKTEQYGVKGVGRVSRFGVQGNSEIPQVFSITSYKSDFKKQIQDASFSLNNRNLLVCKKNASVLRNLLIWLSDYLAENQEQHNIPLLIIDDEADNASLNNMGHKGREYASTINGHIRAILELFSRKTYLGYTATPFANVIQDRNQPAEGSWPISYRRNGETVIRNFKQVSNVFPDDFIELLDPPSNYIGAKQVFGATVDPDTKKIPLIEPVTDYIESFPSKVIDTPEGVRPGAKEELDKEVAALRSPRKDDVFPQQLPESLKRAVECFILGIAVRMKRRPAMAESRLYNPHNTMLIHVSRFTDWQNRTRQLIQEEVDRLIQRTQELPSSPHSIYAQLERTWNQYYAVIIENIRTYLPKDYGDEFLQPVSFDDIKPLLPRAVQGLEVKAINSVTKEKLVYTTDQSGEGKKYIAIGGNRLSRGFTLEGLTINYFIRNTNFADTLLQMGRWFGYRPGYIDCCKLFTTWDAIEKFEAATRTIDELELQFKEMQRMGKTPQDFILRVRTHPGVLDITRPSILKNAKEVKWSYQDTLVQTTQFELKQERIKRAWEEMINLFNGFTIKGDFCVLDTDVTGLFRFLNCPNSFYNFGEQLNHIKKFLDLCAEQDKLKRWRIAVKMTGASRHFIASASTGLPEDIQLSVRSGPSSKDAHALYRREFLTRGIFTGSGQSANIISAGKDMSLWLDPKEIADAEKEFIDSKVAALMEKNKNQTETEARDIARKLTKPERIYREKMSDDTGLLVIYLMDLREVFKKDDEELRRVKEDRQIDDTIPLIGYAIGFPPISANIGGIYLRGDYNIDEDEGEDEEYDPELLNTEEETI